jgi:hypothetical protein
MLFILFGARLDISKASAQEFRIDSAKNGHAELHCTLPDGGILRLPRRLPLSLHKALVMRLAQKRDQNSPNLKIRNPEP